MSLLEIGDTSRITSLQIRVRINSKPILTKERGVDASLQFSTCKSIHSLLVLLSSNFISQIIICKNIHSLLVILSSDFIPHIIICKNIHSLLVIPSSDFTRGIIIFFLMSLMKNAFMPELVSTHEDDTGKNWEEESCFLVLKSVHCQIL